MNSTILTDLCNPYVEILQLEDRLLEVERERDLYREIATIGIHQSHEAHRREQRYRDLIRQQTETIKALRGSHLPVQASEPRERRAA